jgi:hypothetical protein
VPLWNDARPLGFALKGGNGTSHGLSVPAYAWSAVNCPAVCLKHQLRYAALETVPVQGEHLSMPTAPAECDAEHQVSTGIPGLDGVLNGGLDSYRLYLVEGARYWQDNHGEMELSETTKLILTGLQVEPVRVVFDSLSEMRLLAQIRYRYRRQILALKHFFAGRRCTVLLLDDFSSKEGDLQLSTASHKLLCSKGALDYDPYRSSWWKPARNDRALGDQLIMVI